MSFDKLMDVLGEKLEECDETVARQVIAIMACALAEKLINDIGGVEKDLTEEGFYEVVARHVSELPNSCTYIL